MALILTVFSCEDLCPISIESQNADSFLYCCLWHADELLRTSNSSDCWEQVQKEMFKSFLSQTAYLKQFSEKGLYSVFQPWYYS